MRLFLRAALMALAACIAAAIGWSLLAATVGRLFPPYGPPESLRDFIVTLPWAFLGSFYFAVFIAAAAFLPYIAIFFGWLYYAQRDPRWLSAPPRLAGAIVAMALPPALVLAHGFGESSVRAFDWKRGGWAFGFALASGVLGILVALAMFRKRPSGITAPAA